jgi:hypothetical protein
MSALDDLIDYLGDQIEADPADEGFRVDGPAKADWAARKVVQAHRKAAEVERVYREQRDRLDQWWSEEHARIMRTADFMAGHLTAYHAALVSREEVEGVPEKNLTKTINLPSGVKLTRRAQQPVYEVDVAAVCAWIATQPEAARDELETRLLRVKVDADKPGIKTYVTQTGDVPAGVSIEQRGPKYDVSVPVGDAS